MDQYISTYTREQAIEDGVLADVSELAKEAGIIFPVAITSGLYGALNPTEKDEGQDIKGRLWDLFTIFKSEARKGGSLIRFHFFVRRGKKNTRQEIKAICGPGDNAEPVITMMLPEED